MDIASRLDPGKGGVPQDVVARPAYPPTSGRVKAEPDHSGILTGMPSQAELVLRLLLAAGLAGALGIERELTEQPAGFRTHMLVGVGSALFAIVSAYGFQSIAGLGPNQVVRADITRVASQIVVGIGFLGGGAIIKYGASVRGLTTAASLWVTAAIGTAVGIGALAIGSATAAITLLALAGLRPLRAVLRRVAPGRDEFVIVGDRQLDVKELLAAVSGTGAQVREVRITEEAGDELLRVEVNLGHRKPPADLAAAISAVPHVHQVDVMR